MKISMDHAATRTLLKQRTLPRLKLSQGRRITLPLRTMKRYGLTAGEELDLVEHKDMMVLVPSKRIPRDQRWYHTPRWQRMMREAFEDLKKGRALGPFDTVEEAIRALKTAKI